MALEFWPYGFSALKKSHLRLSTWNTFVYIGE